MELAYLPVTSETWADLERLFGPRCAYAGCWCMWWRLPRAEFNRSSAEERKAGLKTLADSGRPPGILAYDGAEPVAWVSIGPRDSYPALERSRTLARVDDTPVWSIVCFFIAKSYRRRGLMADLLRGAAAYAASQGAQVVEGYPVDPSDQRFNSGLSAYTGLVSAFRKAGFVEVARGGARHVIMRYYNESPGALPAPPAGAPGDAA
jgi:GNAT superfamily N-acetyltransferase